MLFSFFSSSGAEVQRGQLCLFSRQSGSYEAGERPLKLVGAADFCLGGWGSVILPISRSCSPRLILLLSLFENNGAGADTTTALSEVSPQLLSDPAGGELHGRTRMTGKVDAGPSVCAVFLSARPDAL